MSYFKHAFCQFSNETVQTFCTDHDLNADAGYNEFDFQISVDEVEKSITRFKRNKVYDVYSLFNEYLLECSNILSPYICRILNAISVSFVIKQNWAGGIIIPLFKMAHVAFIDL